jgi:hypothetical protein
MQLAQMASVTSTTPWQPKPARPTDSRTISSACCHDCAPASDAGLIEILRSKPAEPGLLARG